MSFEWHAYIIYRRREGSISTLLGQRVARQLINAKERRRVGSAKDAVQFFKFADTPGPGSQGSPSRGSPESKGLVPRITLIVERANQVLRVQPHSLCRPTPWLSRVCSPRCRGGRRIQKHDMTQRCTVTVVTQQQYNRYICRLCYLLTSFFPGMIRARYARRKPGQTSECTLCRSFLLGR